MDSLTWKVAMGCARRRGDRVQDVAMLDGLRSGTMVLVGGNARSWSM